MYCINCGKEIKDDSKFCEHCGASQAIPAAPVLPIEESINSAEKDILEAEALIAEAQVKADDITSFLKEEKAETEKAPDDIESFLSSNAQPAAPNYSVPLNENTNYTFGQEAPKAAEIPAAQPYQPQSTYQAPPQAQTYQPQTAQPYQPAQQAPADGTTYQSTYQAPPKKKKPTLIIALVIIAILGAIIVPNLGGGSKAMKSPEDVIEAYFRAVEKSDKTAIINMMPEAWYDHLSEEYPTSSEFWDECDYCWRTGYFGNKLDEYDYDLKEEYSSSDVRTINQNVPGLNAERVITYNVYAYFTNGDSDLIYMDMAVVDGDWYFIEAW